MVWNESDENVESVQLFRLAALLLLTLERREVELTSNQQPGVNSAEVQQQYNAMQGGACFYNPALTL